MTFQLDSIFAAKIKQVHELIDFSNADIKPPDIPPFMRGILNLRQQMISIIDLCDLYKMAPLADMQQAKS
ncbi:chemotaxis protein CheW [Undibacterium sp.]|uniref:chemotaxis protein CheW n=1 Tax=Undibacterium sp. TaxID=1914977 RepID=UPI0039C95045